MTTYIITNDRYSQQPDEVTLEALRDMCLDNGWTDTSLNERAGTIYDERGQVVAVEKSIYDASRA